MVSSPTTLCINNLSHSLANFSRQLDVQEMPKQKAYDKNKFHQNSSIEF
jgi:hypothetical protein